MKWKDVSISKNWNKNLPLNFFRIWSTKWPTHFFTRWLGCSVFAPWRLGWPRQSPPWTPFETTGPQPPFAFSKTTWDKQTTGECHRTSPFPPTEMDPGSLSFRDRVLREGEGGRQRRQEPKEEASLKTWEKEDWSTEPAWRLEQSKKGEFRTRTFWSRTGQRPEKDSNRWTLKTKTTWQRCKFISNETKINKLIYF